MELYIHIPFCIKKCNYCDFLSFSKCYELVPDYVSALLRDIEYESKKCKEKLSTIYIGGGTPSSIDEKYIEMIIKCIHSCYKVEEGAEITIEINPGTITSEKAKRYFEAGINRVSLGVQSFCDAELNLLGRIHNSIQVKEAVDILRNAGFRNISLDLIQALPGQSMNRFINNLKEAIKLNPEHISAYELIIEEGTPFYKEYGPDSSFEADDDLAADIYLESIKVLSEAGYKQYEISNFAKEGYESKHNLGYWQDVKYIGCGLGAAGYDGIARYKKCTNINKYISNPVQADVEKLSMEDRISEYMILGLRTTKGISTDEFKEKFGVDFPDEFSEILNNVDRKYLNITRKLYNESISYSFTPEGFLISNSILNNFV